MEPSETFDRAVRLAASDGGDDSEEFWELIRSLHRTPEKHVFDLVAARCESANPSERLVALYVLGQLGFPKEFDPEAKRPFTGETAPILRRLLGDEDDRVLAAAIVALGHHSIATADDLRDLSKHGSRDVRDAVAFALDSDDMASREILIELMNDSDDGVRDWATFSIGSQTDADTPTIREALTGRLKDSDAETRGEALVGLARRGDASVVELVIAALEAEPVFPVVEAAEILLERHSDARLKAALERVQANS